ncbi:anti-sigma factor family protein [Candidatus Hydrogenedentota bacterium]
MKDHLSLVQIERYAAGELPTAEAERIERHVESCAQCGEILDRLREETSLLESVFSELPGFEPVPKDIVASLTRPEGPSERPRAEYPLVRRLAWAAAVMVAVAAPSLWGLLAMEPTVPSTIKELAYSEEPLTHFLVSTLLKTLC